MCKIEDWMIWVLLSICSICDWKKKTIPIIWIGLLGVVVIVSVFFGEDVNMRLRAGGAFMGVLFLLISKCTKEAIGYGDSWLILFLGIYMGYLEAIGMLFVASFLASIVSLFLLCKCRLKRTATLPFVPFLSVSYLGVILL